MPKAGNSGPLVGRGLGMTRWTACAYSTAPALLRFTGILALCVHPISTGAQTNQAPSSTVTSASATGTHNEPDRTCAQCHAAIYTSYQQTAMAHASGPSKGNVIPGEFTHPRSRVHYKVYELDAKVWLSFDRSAPDEIHGKRELLYFIGSGHRGRTYVFADDGFFFESPVNWYGQKGVWDMTPAFLDARHIPLNLPLSPECLSCHTSDLQQPVPGTENKYRAPIIMQQGISCARCHGSGAAHLNGTGAIVNPDKLSASKRDAVCMQCHLEGSVAIQQPGRTLSDFKPGEELQDSVHYFVLAQTGTGLPSISQFEALFQSKCKIKSGDAMSCMSCHDPHSSPSALQKVAYYRSKCIACHGENFAAKHHPKEQNCAACHMPAVASSNIAHTQATDHRILRTPAVEAPPPLVEALPQLRRFPPTNTKDGDRDLAMAWQSLADEGVRPAALEAQKYLRTALAEQPDDAFLLTSMGFAAQKRGEIQQAKLLYEEALEKDPLATVAAANLGVIAAQTGDINRAIALWKLAFDHQPERTALGINLAKALCAKGRADYAKGEITRVLEFDPDSPEAEKIWRELEASPSKCGDH